MFFFQSDFMDRNHFALAYKVISSPLKHVDSAGPYPEIISYRLIGMIAQEKVSKNKKGQLIEIKKNH